MRLRAALAAKGPPGLWLIDENGDPRFAITINAMGAAAEPRTIEQVCAAIAQALPDEGIELTVLAPTTGHATGTAG